MPDHRRQLTLPAVVAAAALSVFVAACGGNSPSSTSASNSPSTSNSSGQPTPAQIQQAQREVVRFGDCMRSHGVPNFPDPTTDPHAFKEALSPETTHSPAFASAVTTCQHLLPNGGRPPQGQGPTTHSRAQVAAMLAFASCLRAHGFPRFPDPTNNGSVTHQMIASAGINLHQPAVVQTADGCVGVTHGMITRAMVARFIAGQ
jgi:hypothetical protein